MVKVKILHLYNKKQYFENCDTHMHCKMKKLNIYIGLEMSIVKYKNILTLLSNYI
jgi:hypothetical protein